MAQGAHGLRIAHRHAPTLARFGHEVEPDLDAVQRDVLAAERRETNVSVVARVAVPTDPEQADVEQPDRERQGLFAIRVVRGQNASRDRPDFRQPPSEPEHVVELLLVPTMAPEWVVEVLAPALG